jgi:hypothetical protein
VLKEPIGHFLAGGTNLIDLMKMGGMMPEIEKTCIGEKDQGIAHHAG